MLAKELEGKVPPRIAEERGKDISMAGSLNYTADRGPLSVAIEGEMLVVRTDVRIHAEACTKGRCYAGCDPVARTTASVPLRLTSEYRFAPSRVTAQFTQPCKVRALGGFVQVDLTPTIQGQMAPALRRVEQDIDGKLPPIRPQAERMWRELDKPRELPLGACLVTNPRGISQGPPSGTPDSLKARFGIVAYPEVYTKCGAAPPPRPLPPLGQEPQMPPEDDLMLAIVSPLASMGGAFESASPFDAGGGRVRAVHAVVASSGSSAQVDFNLRGDACGDVAIRPANASASAPQR